MLLLAEAFLVKYIIPKINGFSKKIIILVERKYFMEIKDAISFYNFIGQIGLLGSIILIVLITLVASYLIVNISEKLTKNVKLKKRITIVFSLVILVLLLILLIPINERRAKVNKANAIKSYMVSAKNNWIGFREIVQNISFSPKEHSLLPSDEKFNSRVDEIKDIVNDFPDEFSLSTIDNYDKLDTLGVELIDSVAAKKLDIYFEQSVPFMTLKLENYMLSNNVNTLGYTFIRKNIDNRFQDFFLDRLIGKNIDKFIPIDDSKGFSMVVLNPQFKFEKLKKAKINSLKKLP